MQFSVVTPTFNTMPWIKRCVGSVRGQQGVAVEHIIQDGGSADGTCEWLALQTDIRFESKPDDGMYDAINRGWDRASGDILSWLNADEQYLPGTLARVQQVFEENPDVELVCGNAIIVDETGAPLAARRELPLRAMWVAHTFLYIYSCTMFFRSSLRERGLLKFDTTFKISGDVDLVLRLLARGVRSMHISNYFSLFGIRADNLSMRPEQDADLLRELRSGLGYTSSRLVKAGFRAARWGERLLRSHYWPARLRYPYALDEVPAYKEILATRISGRFDLTKLSPRS